MGPTKDDPDKEVSKYIESLLPKLSEKTKSIKGLDDKEYFEKSYNIIGDMVKDGEIDVNFVVEKFLQKKQIEQEVKADKFVSLIQKVTKDVLENTSNDSSFLCNISKSLENMIKNKEIDTMDLVNMTPELIKKVEVKDPSEDDKVALMLEKLKKQYPNNEIESMDLSTSLCNVTKIVGEMVKNGEIDQKDLEAIGGKIMDKQN